MGEMMQAKNIISFDFEKEDRTYRFLMPSGAPLGEAYEAARNFLGEMVNLVNEHNEKVKSDESEDKNEAAEEQEESQEEA